MNGTDATFGRERLAEDIRGLGLERGDVVLVHSSLKAVGWIEPNPSAIVKAFRDVLGPEGTLVVPTLVPALRGLRPLFDLRESPSEMGTLTEIVRKWPGALRSNHPTHSVAAIGRLAASITTGHGQAHGPNSPWGPKALGFDSPWDRLRELNAWVLLLGVGFNRCTILHHAQARYKREHLGITKDTPWPDFDFTLMGEYLESAGSVCTGNIGNATCKLARAGDVIKTALHGLNNESDRLFHTCNPETRHWLDQVREIERTGRPRAAAFRTDVTPTKPSRPVGRPLNMRGLLLEDVGGERAALVLVDHVGLAHGEAMLVRKAVERAANVPVDSVLVVATHTHSGYSYCFWPEAGYDEHLSAIAEREFRAVAGRLEPVRGGWRTASAPGVARCRHIYLKDGRAYTERWAMPSAWHIPDDQKLRRGQSEDEIRVLVLERLDGSRLATVADFGCHNSAGMNSTEMHDDFFGVAMELIEASEGPGCVAFITPGAQGDHDPTVMIQLGGVRDMEYAARVGRRLAGHLLAALSEVAVRDVFRVRTSADRTQVKVRDDWPPQGTRLESREFAAYSKDRIAPAEVIVLAIGGYAMVGIPAELFATP
ncbi:MAG: AAC(3) family N-acetyltransferase, partial [Chloroflexi bacterium]|nr:AAC(3) family N-acetyltransferase [Chloroflexota bacterium]